MWNPQNPSVGDKVARAIVYFVALVYMFLGMSIIADRFMSSIEVGSSELEVCKYVCNMVGFMIRAPSLSRS